MKKLIFLLVIMALFSCGKRGGIEYPGGQDIPKFDRVFD